MANQTASHRPLDPNASPYLKIPPTHFYVYVFPQTPRYNHILPPVLPSPLYTYNIRLQPSPRKSFPISFAQPPSPVSSKKINFSLTPVSSGPRNPKSRLPERSRGMISAVRFGNSGCDGSEKKWQPKFPKNKASLNVAEKIAFNGRRWKNRRREYEKSLPLETNSTSLMIKNIPNKYTRELLIQTLDTHCEVENKKIKNDGSADDEDIVSAYDFLYLPIDFNRRVNAGFAFVNFTNPEAALRFRDAFNGKRWNFFDSSKIAEISRARIQGKAALINNCNGMDFTYGSAEDMPVWFEPARDGRGVVPSKMFTVGKSLLWQK